MYLHEERHCKYVSIRGIAGLCDKKPNRDILSDHHNFDISDYADLRDYDTVFVAMFDLKRFLNEVFYVENKKIILVTGCSDKSSPIEICKLQNVDRERLLNSPHLVHWFTSNCDEPGYKVSCIPLGVDYHTIHRGNHRWGPKKSPLEQEKELISCIPTDKECINTKAYELYSNFHFTRDRYNDRKACIDGLIKQKQSLKVYFERFPSPRKPVWDKHKSFMFELSPLGQGYDCHRTWEALILKTIPVVRKSSIHHMFDDMPVIQVEDWTQLTLENYYQNFHTFVKKNEHKLELKYWMDIIVSKQHGHRPPPSGDS